MKHLKFVVIIFALYFLGYVLGPTIAPMLVKDMKVEDTSRAVVEYKGAQYTIKLAEYEDEALPGMLKITTATKIPTLSGVGQVLLKEGDTVKFLNREGEGLLVEKVGSNGKGTIKSADTDLFQQLAKQIYDKEAGGAVIASVLPAPQPKADPMETPTPVPAPKVVSVPAPAAPIAAADPLPEPTPTETAPAPEPVEVEKLTDEQIVTLMKKSIEGGAVKEFSVDQVKGWEVSGEETIDGTLYQTGLAAYEAATIFGVRPVQAKALIQGGRVARWVYAKSGMEIQ